MRLSANICASVQVSTMDIFINYEFKHPGTISENHPHNLSKPIKPQWYFIHHFQLASTYNYTSIFLSASLTI